MTTRYREILRLRSLGNSTKEIEAGAGCSVDTVRRVVKAALEKGLEWPLPESLGDDAIKRIIYPEKFGKRKGFLEPDYENIHKELKRKGVTRALLYEEYQDKCRAAGVEFCSSTTFNAGYAEWADSQNLTMHIGRKPGQKMEVDWAGTKMNILDRNTGELVDVYIFVACMPFSGKLYAESFFRMDSECWLTAHVHALDFYGGVPLEIVPDNCKTAVTSHKRNSPLVINKAYENFAHHYGCSIIPTRVRKPKDKANVEAGVGLITRRVIAPLRNRTFFTLGELNAAISEKVAQINSAQFARKPGSRASVFELQEQSELAPLPKTPFQVCNWESVTVRSDYHVAVRGCFYSVPYEYIRKTVDVRITQSNVEVFFHGIRIASHARSFEANDWVTDKHHMPENHVSYLEWNIDGIVKRAEDIGPSCARVVVLVMSPNRSSKQALGQGKSLLCLANRYGAEILEEACTKSLKIGEGLACSVASVECICKALYSSKGDVEDGSVANVGVIA
jgi:transposase